MKLFRMLAAAVAALALTAVAVGEASSHHWYSMTLTERRAVVVREIRTQQAPIRWWIRSHKRFPASSVEAARFCTALGAVAPGPICIRGQKLVHAYVILRRIDGHLAARQRAADARRLAAQHFAGWACIHNGAYPGAPHEGNSSSGRYTGPLQMTYPWEGYYVRWHDIPISAVYAIADRVAAARHYDPGWMRSQWPQTYPPCSGYF